MWWDAAAELLPAAVAEPDVARRPEVVAAVALRGAEALRPGAAEAVRGAEVQRPVAVVAVVVPLALRLAAEERPSAAPWACRPGQVLP